jgi:hypothetical protein
MASITIYPLENYKIGMKEGKKQKVLICCAYRPAESHLLRLRSACWLLAVTGWAGLNCETAAVSPSTERGAGPAPLSDRRAAVAVSH